MTSNMYNTQFWKKITLTGSFAVSLSGLLIGEAAYAAGPPAVRAAVGTQTPSTTPAPVGQKNAQGLLAYLKSLQGNHVISGQFVGPGSGDTTIIRQIANKTGKVVGMLGADYWTLTDAPLSQSGPVNAALIDHWNNRGIVTLTSHMPNPDTGGNAWDNDVNFNALITPGTLTNSNYMCSLDQVAAGIKQLKDAGVVVIYRPFHEMNGKWFWWGQGTDSQFIQLWKAQHDYLTNTKGLDNILWWYAPTAGGYVMGRYAGDAYVDLVGVDIYSDNPSQIQNNYNELIATGKPFGFSEFGPCSPECGNTNFDETTLINTIKQNMPKTVLWQQWWERWDLTHVKNASAALNDPYVLNRDSINFSLSNTSPTPSPTFPGAIPHFSQ